MFMPVLLLQYAGTMNPSFGQPLAGTLLTSIMRFSVPERMEVAGRDEDGARIVGLEQ